MNDLNAATEAPSKKVSTRWLHFATEGFTLDSHHSQGLEMVPAGIAPMKADSLICLIDPDDAVRKTVSRYFQSEKYKLETFDSASSFLSRQAHKGPCCLLVDAHLPGVSAVKLQQLFNRKQRTEQIIFTSGQRDIRMCAEVLKAGAADFLAKPLKNSELIEAVESALLRSFKLWRLSKEMDAAKALLDRLTPREREILSFIIAGQINKEIASEVGTTEKTVKKQRARLMEKLKVGSVAELVHFALKYGIKPARPFGSKIPSNGPKSPLYKLEINSYVVTNR